jgi:hypothetical protein
MAKIALNFAARNFAVVLSNIKYIESNLIAKCL